MQATTDVDNEYRKILVIGAKRVGKTSLLSTAMGGSFSRAYRPSVMCTHYFDTDNLLELIDTPGVDDADLNGAQFEHVNEWETVRKCYTTFKNDPLVQEYITESSADRPQNLIVDFDITQASGYLIVYTDEDRAKRVVSAEETDKNAKALSLAIRTKSLDPSDRRVGIFFLHQDGDINVPSWTTHVKIDEDTKSNKQDKNDSHIELVYRDDIAIEASVYHDRQIKYLPTVNAQTGENVAQMLYILRQQLDRLDALAQGFTAPSLTLPSGLSGGAAANAVKTAKKSVGGSTTTTGRKGRAEGETSRGGDSTASTTGSEADSSEEEDEPPPIVLKNGQRASCSAMTQAACAVQ